MMGAFLRVLFQVFVVVTWLGSVANDARAEEVRRAGSVRLETASGGRGPIELVADPDGKSYSAELVIVNEGKEPLVVSRVAVRGDVADPRVPPTLSTRLVDGSVPVTIPPAGTRRAKVSWTPEPDTKLRQLFGHVVVTTSDERTGEVAMGVRARGRSVLGAFDARVLTLSVAVPLLGALTILLVRLAGRRSERVPHLVASCAFGVQTLLAAYVYRAFVPDVSRADGNDGLQFVEHVVWVRRLSAELYLGVDGVGATALFVTSSVAFLSVLLERSTARASSGYYAALLVLGAAVVGAISAMDGVAFLLFASVVLVSAGLLVGAWGDASGRRAAMRMMVPGFFAMVLFTIAIVVVATNADPTFLVDGTKVSTTFSLPELSRVAFESKGATFLGGPLAKVTFVMVLAAALFFLAAFPLHGWLADVVASAPPATGILVATALPTIGLCALLRVGCMVMPEGMRSASGIVVALGAISVAYGALLVLGQVDLRRMAAGTTTAQAGFVLLGAGSLTPQGLSGAIVLGSTRALACGAFLLLTSALYERARTNDVSRLGGVASHMPGWAMAFAAAAFAQSGVLGLGGAWGPFLALLGALSGYAPLALVAAFGLVVATVAHFSAVSRVAFEPLDAEWEKSPVLQPFGGKFPDMTGREWTSIAPLVLLVILLGLWPAPIVGMTTGTVRDLANEVSPAGPDQVAFR